MALSNVNEDFFAAEKHEENVENLKVIESYDEIYRTYRPTDAEVELSISTTSTLKDNVKQDTPECRRPADIMYKETETDKNPIAVALSSKPSHATFFTSDNKYQYPEHLKVQYSQYRIASGQGAKKENLGYNYYEYQDAADPKQSQQNFKYAGQEHGSLESMTAADFYAQQMGYGPGMDMGMPETNYNYGGYSQPIPGIPYQFQTTESDYYKFGQLSDQGLPNFMNYQSYPQHAQLGGGQCDGCQCEGCHPQSQDAACATSFASTDNSNATFEAASSSHQAQYYSADNTDTSSSPAEPTCSPDSSNDCSGCSGCCCSLNRNNSDESRGNNNYFYTDRMSLDRDRGFEMPESMTVTQCQVGHSLMNFSGNMANIAGAAGVASLAGLGIPAGSCGCQQSSIHSTHALPPGLDGGGQATCPGPKMFSCAMPSMPCYGPPPECQTMPCYGPPPECPPMACQSPQPQYCACSGNCLDIEGFLRRTRATRPPCLPSCQPAPSLPCMGCCPTRNTTRSFCPGMEPRYCANDTLQSQTVYTADYQPYCGPGNNFNHFPKCESCGSCGSCGGCSSCYGPPEPCDPCDAGGGCMPPLCPKYLPFPCGAGPSGSCMMPPPGCFPCAPCSSPCSMPCPAPCPTACCRPSLPTCPVSCAPACSAPCMMPYEMPIDACAPPAGCSSCM